MTDEPLDFPDQAGPGSGISEETVDGIPVLAKVRAIEPATVAQLPAVHAAAVAASGFLAGAATLALVKRHHARKQRHAPRRAIDLLPVVGTRTFLVDVHLIGRPRD
jgi:hypothetical protein